MHTHVPRAHAASSGASVHTQRHVHLRTSTHARAFGPHEFHSGLDEDLEAAEHSTVRLWTPVFI